jgi:hypothetical protein
MLLAYVLIPLPLHAKSVHIKRYITSIEFIGISFAGHFYPRQTTLFFLSEKASVDSICRPIGEYTSRTRLSADR